jgi:hypothetical protein
VALLFEIRENHVYPKPEILLISPFKEIWERDKSKGKQVAIQEFTYIEFMSSAKSSNPFRGYSKEERHHKIREIVIQEKGWKPDSLVYDGMQHWIKYQQEASEIYELWRAAKTATHNLSRFLTQASALERDEKGKPLYKPRDITGALSDIPKITKSINELQEKIDKELYEDTRTKSNKEISIFADPNSLK